MALCPLSCTAYINGIFYYYCQDCSVLSPPTYVGAQDTRPHTTGISCPNPLDPLQRVTHYALDTSKSQAARAATAAAPVAILHTPEVYSLIDPSLSIRQGVSFTQAFEKTIEVSPLWVDLQRRDNNKFKCTFQLNGAPKSVRLFDIRVIREVTAGSITFDVLRVGQQLENPSDAPDPVSDPDSRNEDADYDSLISGNYHKIRTRAATPEVYYVQLKD
jgi:hypothetical protein